jgi:hypothetical protein
MNYTDSKRSGLHATTNGEFRKSSIRCAKRIGKSLCKYSAER